ncbi:hypothetical protein FITA111629_13625 [Filibacter tadaridae]|uniref:Uncharacterized protein n=1 Tax=Filibacter tadaridae TaxID=2483811 RepID=A0A3P5WST8_9BACL|nr:hypothetical protein [Filibacter tadaridae]VDC24685.1 hypothetical protein FILTAD_01068 [Filibacter tadaridae]
MNEKNHQEQSKNQDNKEFTGMPKEEPYPDFEPKQSIEKQVEQFKDTAENGENTTADKKK